MSVLSRVLGLDGGERRSVSGGSFGAWDTWPAGASSAAGERIDAESAMRVSAVYACVRILSDTIATLPNDSYIRRDGTPVKWRPRPRWLDRPDPSRPHTLGNIQLFGQVMVSLLLAGNAYVVTYRDRHGVVLALEVLDPRAVTPYAQPDGTVTYQVGSTTDTRTPVGMVGPLDLLHIPGMMRPGAIEGMSPVRYAAETVGVSLAAQRYGAAFFANSAMPSALAEVPGALSPTGVESLKRAWNDLHRGSGNAGRLGVLTEGAKLEKISLTPEESQFLGTRQFQISDIARVFGVPPHLIADASGSTSWGSGLAEQNIAFLQLSLRPWIERIEQSFSWLLQTDTGNDRVFVRCDTDALMRGSLPEQVTTFAAGLAAGIYTIDEVRGWLDLAPLADGAGAGAQLPAPAAPPPAVVMPVAPDQMPVGQPQPVPAG